MQSISRRAGAPGVLRRPRPVFSPNRGYILAALIGISGCNAFEPSSNPDNHPSEGATTASQGQAVVVPPAVGVRYSGRHYEVEVLAANGENGILGVSAGPSINDNGRVAFTASVSGGQAVFYSDGSPDAPVVSLVPAAPVNVTPGWIASSRTFFDHVQLTNDGWVLAQDRVSSGAYFQRRWDTASPDTNVLMARSGESGSNFNSLQSRASMNNQQVIAFAGLANNSATNILGTGMSPSYTTVSTPTLARPMIADDGRIVSREGSAAQATIRVRNATLGTVVDLTSPTFFSEVGDQPGISDDGSIIVFQGVPTTAGVTYLQTTPGPGIFASIRDPGGTYRTTRVVGTEGELGLNPTGSAPEKISFNAYGTGRIAVVHNEMGDPGIDDDSFVVMFPAKPDKASFHGEFNANMGLWTVRVDLRERDENNRFRTRISRPVPAVQIGTTLGDRTVTAFDHWDSIASAKNMGGLRAWCIGVTTAWPSG